MFRHHKIYYITGRLFLSRSIFLLQLWGTILLSNLDDKVFIGLLMLTGVP